MKRIKEIFGTLTIMAAVAIQAHFCSGASWEGMDDFSGTLAEWDTTYIHISRPTDGFYLTNATLQFIRTVTTNSYESSGILIWPHSLPSSVNWTVTVDTHLNAAYGPNGHQEIRSALYVFESITNAFSPFNIALRAALANNDVAGDVIDGVPVAGWDYTLGISFDANTQTGTSFYYPSNQPSQLVVLTNLNMGNWTNRLVMLYGLSEYWAVSSGQVWLDNFNLYGTANFPSLAIAKAANAVWPKVNNLLLSHQYQLQVSSDLNNWTNQGSPFTATTTNMDYPQYWDVHNVGRLFFRLQVSP
jgi:hypothetical protein